LVSFGKRTSSSSATVPGKGKPAWDIFQDVTLYLMKSNNSLDIFSTKHDPSLTKTSHRPSWVPDYTVWPEVTVMRMPKGIPYSASGTFKIDTSITATNKLHIKDSRIDRIDSLGSEWQGGAYWVDQFKEWFSFLDTTPFLKQFLGFYIYPNGFSNGRLGELTAND
jgi:hypothetical protein